MTDAESAWWQLLRRVFAVPDIVNHDNARAAIQWAVNDLARSPETEMGTSGLPPEIETLVDRMVSEGAAGRLDRGLVKIGPGALNRPAVVLDFQEIAEIAAVKETARLFATRVFEYIENHPHQDSSGRDLEAAEPAGGGYLVPGASGRRST